MSTSKAPKFKLGIELGTTNSRAAIVRDGHVMVLKNHEGENFIILSMILGLDTGSYPLSQVAFKTKNRAHFLMGSNSTTNFLTSNKKISDFPFP